ncbi:Clavaminate synthase-like protein, partial [Bimuria novae-zelandiae CBS 107.79]
ETETTQTLPPSVEKHRQDIVDFDNKCFEASMKVLDILSWAFNLPENYFRFTHKDVGSNSLTLLHYPSLDRPAAGDDIRTGSHKDQADLDKWGDITLLFQEKGGQPGLQVYLPTEASKKSKGFQLVQGDFNLESGTWISAPIVPNTVLVNVGLTLDAKTNGLCKANVHRVIFPPTPEGTVSKARKSIPYFSTPSFEIVILPIYR